MFKKLKLYSFVRQYLHSDKKLKNGHLKNLISDLLLIKYEFKSIQKYTAYKSSQKNIKLE